MNRLKLCRIPFADDASISQGRYAIQHQPLAVVRIQGTWNIIEYNNYTVPSPHHILPFKHCPERSASVNAWLKTHGFGVAQAQYFTRSRALDDLIIAVEADTPLWWN